MDYGGLLEARVRDIICRISPIPNKGLKIPVTLIMKKDSTNSEVFQKLNLSWRVLYRTVSYKGTRGRRT